jgi:hypothetical protein
MDTRPSRIGKELRDKVNAYGFADRLRQGSDWSSGKIESAEIGWDLVHLLVESIIKLEERLDSLEQRLRSQVPPP